MCISKPNYPLAGVLCKLNAVEDSLEWVLPAASLSVVDFWLFFLG